MRSSQMPPIIGGILFKVHTYAERLGHGSPFSFLFTPMRYRPYCSNWLTRPATGWPEGVVASGSMASTAFHALRAFSLSFRSCM